MSLTPDQQNALAKFAFPVVWNDGKEINIAAGLTKREWFAGMALCGLMANTNETFHGATHASNALNAKNAAKALIEALNNE